MTSADQPAGQGRTAGDAWAEGRARWELDRRPTEVLLIGSQLAYGSVGMNGVLPQLAPARVACVPTIVLGALPHYPRVHASPQPAEWIAGVLADLAELGVLDEIDSVCTGYFASPEQVHAVADALEPVVQDRPQLRILVDPTLGDSDVGLYTDPAVAPALRERLLPLASGIVPNRFELGMLAGLGPETEPVIAARALLGPRAQWAVVSGGSATGATGQTLTDLIVTPDTCVALEHPLMPTAAKGTGDAFAGALLASLRAGSTVADAVAAAAGTVQTLLR